MIELPGHDKTLTPPVTPPRKNPWIAFRRHFLIYAVVAGSLAVLNWWIGNSMWAHWVAIGWGIGILGHAAGAWHKASVRSEL